jgi:hypothetical protein
MTSIIIAGNKPLGPNGECEMHPEEEIAAGIDFQDELGAMCIDYQKRHGKCSSIIITVVNPPTDH